MSNKQFLTFEEFTNEQSGGPEDAITIGVDADSTTRDELLKLLKKNYEDAKALKMPGKGHMIFVSGVRNKKEVEDLISKEFPKLEDYWIK